MSLNNDDRSGRCVLESVVRDLGMGGSRESVNASDTFDLIGKETTRVCQPHRAALLSPIGRRIAGMAELQDKMMVPKQQIPYWVVAQTTYFNG